MGEPPRPRWSTPAEALHVWFAPSTLRKTIALVVGRLLCLINLGLDLPTGAKIALNFLAPFCVSSAGVLSATRRRG